MGDLGLGAYKSIDAFVEAKLKAFSDRGVSFETLFSLMFQERENILYERSRGYRMELTTYGQAYDSILRRASLLRRRLSELPEGAVVGLSMENSLQWIENFWAILLSGFRPLLINLRLGDGVLAGALRDADARAVISDGRRYDLPTVSAEELDQGSETGEAGEPGPFGTEILVMSSGTSMHVKLCAYTAEEFYRQILGSSRMIRECSLAKRHYEDRLKLLAFLPFYHVFGLIAMYLWFAFFSRTFVHLEDMSPQTILGTIRRHKVTHIFAVPLFWEKVYDEAVKTVRARGEKTEKKLRRGLKLAKKLRAVPPLGNLFSRLAFREVRENLFGESISFLITGGSAIRPEVLEFFNSIGYRLCNGYGMTEVGITSVELSGTRKYLDGGFVGRPMAGVEYRLDGGELLVRGPVTAKYIIEDGVRRERTEWFRTRDLAEEKNGHFRILGRKDDLVISASGENLNPNLIESGFSLPGVSGACLIGPEQDGETVPVLLVSVNKYQTPARFAALDRAVRDRIGEMGLTGAIGKLVYISDPLTAEDEFKKNRLRLRLDYEAGRLHPVEIAEAGEAETDRLYLRVLELFAAAVGKDPEEIGPEGDFFLDCGGTSLDYFAMVTGLREEFSVPFPTESGSSRNTVRSLYDYIKAELDHDSIL